MSWKDLGYDQFQNRQPKSGGLSGVENKFVGGAEFDATLDEMEFNRMIKLKNLQEIPQGSMGKIYWDNENKKYKLWVGEVGKWVDVVWTSTSTSTSSTSTSSTSTSTTSTSTSTTSTSTTSTSTTT